MRTLTASTLLAMLTLVGCSAYPDHPHCWVDDCWEDDCWEDDCWEDDCWEDDCWEDDCSDDTVDTDDEPVIEPHGFFLTPFEVEQGSSFLASLQAEDDQVDFEAISAVHINGLVQITASDARSRELVLFVEVDPAADVGEAAIFVSLGEEMIMLEQPLVIYEAGSGHEPGEPGEPEC